MLDPIRKEFAKANGVKPALFSANSEGACPACKGAGVIFTELGVMATVESTCEECEGKRFQGSVLEYTLGDRNIAEVLAMSVTEAEEFFGDGEAHTPAAHKILDRLADVGLGYLSLGQPLTTLSGGERQRLKLATRMAEKGDVYVLDEPTTGLHLADVEQLLGLLDRLVDSGKSVIVIAHHQAVMAQRRLDHRPRPRRRPRRRPDRLRGHTRRPRRRPLHPHRRAPRDLRRHLTADRPGPGALQRYTNAMATIQIREIPEDAYEIIRKRARASGRSIQAYMREVVVDFAGHPTTDEVLAMMEAVRAGSDTPGATRESIAADLAADRR